jgi:hypothetical protein
LAGSADSNKHLSLRFGYAAVFAGITAVSAAEGLVLEAALCVEFLFAGSEYEFLTAVFTY